MKVLMPLLSKKEAEEKFLEKALKGVKEVILLLVVDKDILPNTFGFAASEIRQGNNLIEDLKELIGKKRKKCSEVIEWGSTLTKIDHLAKLENVNSIILKKQENHFFKQLVKELKKISEKPIKII